MTGPKLKSLRERAMACLARREYSRAELQAKLSRFSEPSAEVEVVLDELTERGWQSDERYAAAVVRHRQDWGQRRLRQVLAGQGIDEPTAQQALADRDGDELSIARQVWQKKFGCLPQDQTEKARQWRFLASRGFEYRTVQLIWREAAHLCGVNPLPSDDE